MRNATRLLFNAYVSQIALLSNVPDATKTFTVDPVVGQKLEEKIQQSSEFLSKINSVPVDQQEGQKVGIGVTRPIAGRTDTSGGVKRPVTDPTDSEELDRYRCEKTNYDHAIRYAKLDAWAHRPEFQTLIRDVIIKQQGRDRIMIGWNGTSAAATTDRVANPLLQDVNIGWLEQIRTKAPARVMDDGALSTAPTKAIYVDATGEILDAAGSNAATADADYANIDALAYDAVNLMEEWHRDDTDLVVIVGRDLVHEKYLNVINAAGDNAMQQEARDRILTLPKQVGGKTAIMVPFFPANAMLVTSLDNLAIYTQNGTRRRMVIDRPELDQVENYESVNEAYVVEDFTRVALVENIVMGKKPA
ncbi:MAG: phage major capsid protein, P2 family [Bacillota bacterium]